ncbi:hypothetical protein F5Y19DRAFT_491578 [Xylariaceae sp. FL1651]|nr:hypothetical protein F5Y19DRAFT_491578 [Xylariaceae sp. FL1651]
MSVMTILAIKHLQRKPSSPNPHLPSRRRFLQKRLDIPKKTEINRMRPGVQQWRARHLVVAIKQFRSQLAFNNGCDIFASFAILREPKASIGEQVKGKKDHAEQHVSRPNVRIKHNLARFVSSSTGNTHTESSIRDLYRFDRRHRDAKAAQRLDVVLKITEAIERISVPLRELTLAEAWMLDFVEIWIQLGRSWDQSISRRAHQRFATVAGPEQVRDGQTKKIRRQSNAYTTRGTGNRGRNGVLWVPSSVMKRSEAPKRSIAQLLIPWWKLFVLPPWEPTACPTLSGGWGLRLTASASMQGRKGERERSKVRRG